MISKKLLSIALIYSALIPTISFSASNQDTPFKFQGEEEQAVQENPVFRMHQQITSTFDEMFRNFFNNGGFTAAAEQGGNDKFIPFSNDPFGGLNAPKTNVAKDKNKIEISVEMPGIDKDKIDLEIAPGFLTISYNEESKKELKDKNYIMAERKVGAVRRVIPLPYGSDIENAKAEYKNGVVYITVPTMEESKLKPRKLEID